MADLHVPPYPLCSASQKESFALTSTKERWPKIMTDVIKEINAEESHERKGEAHVLTSSIEKLLDEMKSDASLIDIQDANYPKDTDQYNAELTALRKSNQSTWFTAPWLFAECYMYRRLRSFFSATQYWKEFDPFQRQKLSVFKQSGAGAAKLAQLLQTLVKREAITDDLELEKEWLGMLETCLWGNATDLSLLTSITQEDIVALQSVERGKDSIIHNDIKASWNYVKNLKSKRFDIVLDNSGFEVFSDLIFADWLVTLSPFCEQVVFHPKLMGWFVSDVTPKDFELTISSLLDRNFFDGISDEERDVLKELAKGWEKHFAEGRFKFSVPIDLPLGGPGGELAEFWTSPYPFSFLPEKAPQLLEELQKSSLVIFKGDLNYRKLTYDAWWPTTTDFEDTLGNLRGKIDILSLRTCKADVCVGLAPGKAEELDQADPSWRVSGKYVNL